MTLNDAELRMLGDLADALIPSAPGKLSASDVGIAGPLLANIEKFAPERLPLLRKVIDHAGRQGADAALADLQEKDAVTFDLFCETIAALYFMAPAVRDAVRYPGRIAVPARTDIADLEELLLPVLDAGFAPLGYEEGRG